MRNSCISFTVIIILFLSLPVSVSNSTDSEDFNPQESLVQSGEIALQAGLHPLRINYLAATDAAAVSLEWQVPGG